MNKQRLHEETIGVHIPGRGHQIATVRVRATDSDEDVLRGISKVVGTRFNVTGVRYELVSVEPFKLKRLNGTKKRELTVDDPPEEEILETDAPSISITVTSQPSDSVPVQTTVQPSLDVLGFQVGETWRTKDKRRGTIFKVVSINGDVIITDDGRRVRRDRSRRYEKIQAVVT